MRKAHFQEMRKPHFQELQLAQFLASAVMMNSQGGGNAPAGRLLGQAHQVHGPAAGNEETAFPVTAPGADAGVMKNSAAGQRRQHVSMSCDHTL